MKWIKHCATSSADTNTPINHKKNNVKDHEEGNRVQMKNKTQQVGEERRRHCPWAKKGGGGGGKGVEDEVF